jgi:hypothetical protein
MPRRRPDPEFPLTVVIDTAEQLPYAFAGVPADREFGGGCWRVPTVRGSLVWGDYSLAGHEAEVAVERKSKADLFRTVGQERDRFVRELAALADYRFAAVVVEAEWSEVFDDPPPFSQLPPKLLYRNVLAWQQRYPRVHWWFVPGRDVAEVTTLRILERFWKEQQK